MSDYAADISTFDYLYMREITITEKSGEDQIDLPVKLQLDSTNFNFDLENGFIAGTGRVNYEEMTHWASSNFQGLPSDCSDGDFVSYWRQQLQLPGWWKVDLGSGNAQRITGIKLRCGSGDSTTMVKDFIVSGSNNNSSWQEVYSGTAAQNLDTQTFIFDSYTESYRYYKVDILNNYGHTYTDLSLINLIEVLGDVHLGEKNNGTHILNRWVPRWDNINKEADIWFKLPQLLANETKTLYAYWGNTTPSGLSDIHSVGFLFSEHFDDNTIYNNNWSVGGNVDVNKYFDSSEICLINQRNTTGYIQTKNNPIPPLSSWATEIGFTMRADTINNTWMYSHMISFYGTGVPNFRCYFAADGVGITEDEEYGVASPRTENFQHGETTYPTNYDSHKWGSLVPESYHQHFFAYYLPTETIYMGIYDRDVSKISDDCPDFWKGGYVETKERRIEGNSDSRALRIWGAHRGSYAVWAGTEIYIDWVIIRKYLGPYEPEFDTDNLYVGYEQIDADSFVYDYGSDVTNTGFEHTTSSGGDPTHLSDNLLSVVWCSDPDVAEDSVDLTINFGIWGTNLVSDGYLHYDSGHVLYYNAAKLSDEDEDINNNNYWQGTTTSGWACIDFGSNINNVGVIGIKSVTSNLAGTVKNYKIEGSYTYTNNWEDEHWQVLDEGQFNQSTDWQSAIFVNGTKYRFYRLKVLDTYGGNIALQEWKMFNYNQNLGKKVISVLKLKPDATDSNFIYFPKQIVFYGSNDGYNWTTFISTKNTYTPVDAAWQEYSFTNTTPYYHYKLVCTGNWNNNSGKMCISEWSMHERNIEKYTNRILAGTGDNYNSIWAWPDCTFDSGDFYVVNNLINVVSNDTLSRSMSITGDARDLNVI